MALCEDVTGVLLAGGLGTRLRAVVADRPKVLAPVHGRPWVTFLLDQLANAGLRQVVMLTGYNAEQVHHALGDAYAGMRLTYSTERTPLGTAGALRAALPLLKRRTILLMNGDSYCAANLAELHEFHCRCEADISMVLARSSDPSRFGAVVVDREGRVIAFEEKRQSSGGGWINAGVYLMATRLVQAIPLGRPVSLERESFPAWVGRKSFFGFSCEGPFLDIGTPESYARAATFFSCSRELISA
jgi:NDP-sugar pyrophosphorylase family protein